MSKGLLRAGGISLTSCFSRCNACNKVRHSVQFTGPNGYVTLCLDDCFYDLCIAVVDPQLVKAPEAGQEITCECGWIYEVALPPWPSGAKRCAKCEHDKQREKGISP